MKKLVYIRYEKNTESGWNVWGFLSVRRSCIEEDMADGYELEVEVLNEDVATLQ